ncbi:manganese efflux pump MntP [Anaerostipes sp.]|uniref:manganese efflux pump MntP n=1 Tax=Anaerostipes sp. TaxID=1872530 RepID=UPI0025BE8135|nr:manganese efflux pump MntP family protein [Anaerostipes sp.]MBS7008557.1 manganese efflux pump [Anaerostipes sp.]
MNIIEIVMIGIGLSMDAFAVSVGKGLSMGRVRKNETFWIALFFGGFQALMPVAGYLAGKQFAGHIMQIDHWIAFVLLVMIGLNMLKEGLSGDDEESDEGGFSFRELLVLAVATSIDALAVGVTFSFLNVNLAESVTVIGCITFVISLAGVIIGSVFGDKLKEKAEIMGGLILIILGCKILIEHLFF